MRDLKGTFPPDLLLPGLRVVHLVALNCSIGGVGEGAFESADVESLDLGTNMMEKVPTAALRVSV